MPRFGSLLTGVVLTAAVAYVPAASAQYDDDLDGPPPGTVMVEMGGGVQFIELPDMRFTFLTDSNGDVERKQTNGELSNYGGAISGSVYVPIRSRISFVASGFYSEVDNSRRQKCESANGLDCTVQDIVDIPNQLDSWSFAGFTTKTDREVDYWGATSEVTFGTDRRLKPRRDGGFLFDYYHWGVGFNVRGLDQDNKLRLHTGDDQDQIRYDETLDTTYYGGYLSVTGEFNILGYLGIGGNWNIRSFATFRGGVYSADTDYSGRFNLNDQLDSHLRLSDDETTFIGGASFETRLPLSKRMSLSLLTDYEYLSYVPRMRYVDSDDDFQGNIDHTFIDDDDALMVRTQLRLNVGLGPDAHYDEVPLK